EARHLTLVPNPLAPGVYHSLMDLNFRRLGQVFYRPECEGCRECRMLRVPVASFRPSRAQRRCLARNADLRVESGELQSTPEKHGLSQRSRGGRHDGQRAGSHEEFDGFLYTSCLDPLEVRSRLGERLIGVGIADREPQALSAVYCYFDP